MGRTRRFIMLDDTVWEETKRRAVQEGGTANRLVETALRGYLEGGSGGDVSGVPVVHSAERIKRDGDRDVSAVSAAGGRVGDGVERPGVRRVDVTSGGASRKDGVAGTGGHSAPGLKAGLERAVEAVAPGTVVHLDVTASAVPGVGKASVETVQRVPPVPVTIDTGVDPDLGF